MWAFWNEQFYWSEKTSVRQLFETLPLLRGSSMLKTIIGSIPGQAGYTCFRQTLCIKRRPKYSPRMSAKSCLTAWALQVVFRFERYCYFFTRSCMYHWDFISNSLPKYSWRFKVELPKLRCCKSMMLFVFVFYGNW